jgi:hypothetical protein
LRNFATGPPPVTTNRLHFHLAHAGTAIAPLEAAFQKEEIQMTVERYLRLIAGCFVLATLLLGYFHSPYWFLFTGFVALNLIQSAFTDWCPMMSFLRWLGAKSNEQTA